MKHQHWLVLYDICDPKRLREIEKIVAAYGERVQRSVFESDCNDILIDNLEKRLHSKIEGDDFVAIVPLCETDWQKIERYGIVQESNFVQGAFAIL
jgi:CRISPR-associated protein Cas2